MSKLDRRTGFTPPEPSNMRREQDRKLEELLMAHAIKHSLDKADTVKVEPKKHRIWMPAWFSIVLLMAAIPFAFWIHESSGEDDFYS